MKRRTVEIWRTACDDAAIERRRGLFAFTRWRLLLLLRSPARHHDRVVKPAPARRV